MSVLLSVWWCYHQPPPGLLGSVGHCKWKKPNQKVQRSRVLVFNLVFKPKSNTFFYFGAGEGEAEQRWGVRGRTRNMFMFGCLNSKSWLVGGGGEAEQRWGLRGRTRNMFMFGCLNSKSWLVGGGGRQNKGGGWGAEQGTCLCLVA